MKPVVLIVDDEPAARFGMKRALEKEGYTILEAAHPGEALEMATRAGDTIDLLLTDVVMPRMSGQVLAKLLADDRPDLTVLFMSGYTDNAVLHHDIIEADQAYIQKPFSPDDLARAVRRLSAAL